MSRLFKRHINQQIRWPSQSLETVQNQGLLSVLSVASSRPSMGLLLGPALPVSDLLSAQIRAILPQQLLRYCLPEDSKLGSLLLVTVQQFPPQAKVNEGIWGYWELSSSHQLASIAGSDLWKASQVASHLVRNVFVLFEDLFSLQSTTEERKLHHCLSDLQEAETLQNCEATWIMQKTQPSPMLAAKWENNCSKQLFCAAN